MLHQSKEKIRSGGRKGQAKRAREMRQRRQIAIERNLAALGKANVARLAEVTGRSPAVVRAALKESKHAVKRDDGLWHFTAGEATS